MKAVKVESRSDPFVERARTTIFKEVAKDDDGYVSTEAFYHGYSVQSLLEKGYSQTDMIFLLMQGDLPSASQRKILDALCVAICNPGPRDPATRSVMEVAVSKTRSQHFLPIGLMVLGGQKAAGLVETSMRFLRLNKKKNPSEIAQRVIADYPGPKDDLEIAPGFGPSFEQREPRYINIATAILEKFKDENLFYLNWSLAFDRELSETECGMKISSLTAAVFLDLGFHPRMGPGLFQLLSAPGILAHGFEMMNKPISAMPFVSDDNYHFVSNKS